MDCFSERKDGTYPGGMKLTSGSGDDQKGELRSNSKYTVLAKAKLLGVSYPSNDV